MRKQRMRYWSRDRPKTRDTKQRHPKHPDPNTKSKFKLMEVPVMKHLKRIFALCLVLALSLMIIPAAFAATVPTASGTAPTSPPVSMTSPASTLFSAIPPRRTLWATATCPTAMP